jgi:5-methyltetrahydropteroyltriglutamate--homocysteine methyltransferase
LLALLIARERDEAIDEAQLDAMTAAAVDDIVARQVRTGISVVNDGEMSKMTYATYARTVFPGSRRGRAARFRCPTHRTGSQRG